MKYWLSHLPLEVWVDVFCYPWKSREEIGQIVDKLKDHNFAEHLQFYLHDWGKRKLPYLIFEKGGLRKCIPITPDLGKLVKMDIPLTPVPGNIKSFDIIHISHFDQQTINFLRRIRPLLVAGIKLKFRDIREITFGMNYLRVILDNLLPLLALEGNNNSLVGCDIRALPTIGQCFGEKLAKINIIEAEASDWNEAMLQATVDFFMTWLPAPNSNNGSKLLFFLSIVYGFIERLSTAIRQEFLASNHPCTFAITVRFPPQWQFAEFHLNNNIGEELHCVRTQHGHFADKIQVTRHLANRGTELQEWISQNKPTRYNTAGQKRINIASTAIGLIDGMDAPGNAEDAQQKQSTSKDT